MAEVTDPALIAELNDRRRAQQAGVDYDTVAKTRTAKANKAATGSIFGTIDDKADGSSIGGFFRGLVQKPVTGISQMATHALNAGQKMVGMDPNSGMFGGPGVFSDAEVKMADALPKVQENQYQEARKRSGRSGVDVAQLLGAMSVPVPGLSKFSPLMRGATQGAVGAAMEPVDNSGDNYAMRKAADALTGAAVGGAIGKVGSAVANKLTPKAGQSGLAEATEAANRLGVEPGLGNITNNHPLARATHMSANVFGGGGISRRAEQVENQLGNAVDSVASQIGSGRTSYDAGQAAKQGIGGFVDRFKDNANKMYSKVDNLVSPDHNVDMTNTIMSMIGPVNKFKSNPELGQQLGNGRLQQFAQSIAQNPQNPGALNFNEAQALRSEIGRMMGGSELVNGVSRGELSQVYKSLTEDMRGSLQQAGNQNALNAFDRATDYYRAGQARINGVLDKIYGGAKDTASNEAISNRVLNMVKNDANGAAALRRSLKPEEWDTVASSIFRKLGEPTPGNMNAQAQGFSPSKFLTDFNKLQQNKRAFDFTFGGTRYEKLAPMYRDLGLVSERLRDNSRLVNTSGSGYYGTLAGLLGSAFVNPLAPAKAVAANKAFSTLMASPAFLKWAIRAGRIVNRGRAGTSSALDSAARNHLSQLAGMYSANTPEAEAVNEILGSN